MFEINIIVTGANGFVGTHTLRGLLKKSYNVKAVDVRTDKLDEFIHSDKCEIHKMDILSEGFKDLIENGDKVLHLAAIAKFYEAETNPQMAIHVNVEGTLNVIKACMEKNADRLVYSSTGSVYSQNVQIPIREDSARIPFSIYGLTKKMAEDWIMYYSNQLRHVILRYAYVYGEDKDWGAVGAFLKKLSNNERPVVFGGNQTSDFIYIKDVVKANLLALETKYTNQVYNIGTSRATSIQDLCECCIDAVKSDLKMKITPARDCDYPILVYNISKAGSLLHFEPEWSVAQGIKNMVNALT